MHVGFRSSYVVILFLMPFMIHSNTYTPGDMPRHTAHEMIYLTNLNVKNNTAKPNEPNGIMLYLQAIAKWMNFSTREPSEIGLCRTYAGCLLLVLVCILFSYYYLLVCRRRHLFACFNFSSFLFIGSLILGSISFWYVAVFFHLYSFFSLYFASFSLKCNDILWHIILFVAVVFLFLFAAAAAFAASSASVVVNLFIDDFNFVLRTYFRCLVSFSQWCSYLPFDV